MEIKKNLPKVPELIAPELGDPMISSYDIALIIDGIVHSVGNYTEEFSNILLSNPVFVQVDFNNVKEGYLYNPENSTFSMP
jgi:hypothetical protein